MLSSETLQYVAKLARIRLEEGESRLLSGQLQEILNFIDSLNKVNVENINPTSHILPINNIFREDNLLNSLPIDKTLSNAPQKEDNFFKVPKIIN